MVNTCEICKGYGLIKLNTDNCVCSNVCAICENKDKTGYVECKSCLSTGSKDIVKKELEKNVETTSK